MQKFLIKLTFFFFTNVNNYCVHPLMITKFQIKILSYTMKFDKLAFTNIMI